MKKQIHRFKIGVIFIMTIGIIIFFGEDRGKKLEGSHLLQNIIGTGGYSFQVEALQTGEYTFEVYDFNKNMSYEVYDNESEKLICTGKVGYSSEGYRPFIEMSLEGGHTYKVECILEDVYTCKVANIKLCDIS